MIEGDGVGVRFRCLPCLLRKQHRCDEAICMSGRTMLKILRFQCACLPECLVPRDADRIVRVDERRIRQQLSCVQLVLGVGRFDRTEEGYGLAQGGGDVRAAVTGADVDGRAWGDSATVSRVSGSISRTATPSGKTPAAKTSLVDQVAVRRS